MPLSQVRWAPSPRVSAPKAHRSETKEPVPAKGRLEVAAMQASVFHFEAVKKLVALQEVQARDSALSHKLARQVLVKILQRILSSRWMDCDTQPLAHSLNHVRVRSARYRPAACCVPRPTERCMTLMVSSLCVSGAVNVKE